MRKTQTYVVYEVKEGFSLHPIANTRSTSAHQALTDFELQYAHNYGEVVVLPMLGRAFERGE